MNKRISAFVFLACSALAGCASGPQLSSQDVARAHRPFICTSKAECDTDWSRAQVWVAQHSAYRIQIASQSVIETYGPGGSSPALAYELTRSPNNDGTETIHAVAACDNIFVCRPSPTLALLSLRIFMRTGSD